MFGWFKSKPTFRILERSSGEHVLQEFVALPCGGDMPVEMYDDRGVYESHQAAIDAADKLRQRRAQARTVRETYFD